MAKLREVELDGAVLIEELGDWSGAVSVETVRLGETPLAGHALDGLALAPRLRDVWVHSRNGEAAQRLIAARPDVAVHVWGDAVRPGQITVGPLHAIPIEDEWCVLQDLCDLLGRLPTTTLKPRSERRCPRRSWLGAPSTPKPGE